MTNWEWRHTQNGTTGSGPRFQSALSPHRLRTAAKLAAEGVPAGYLKALTEDDFDEVMDVVICKEMKWTLDYVRSLGAVDRTAVEAIINGLHEGENEKVKRG